MDNNYGHSRGRGDTALSIKAEDLYQVLQVVESKFPSKRFGASGEAIDLVPGVAFGERVFRELFNPERRR